MICLVCVLDATAKKDFARNDYFLRSATDDHHEPCPFIVLGCRRRDTNESMGSSRHGRQVFEKSKRIVLASMESTRSFALC